MPQRNAGARFSAMPFTNISSKDFIGKWDGEQYTIKAGETKYYPPFLARHFAKHLTDRILIDKGMDKRLRDKKLRAEYVAKMLGEVIEDEPKKEEKPNLDMTEKVETQEFEGLKKKQQARLEEMSWQEIRSLASEKGVLKPGMNREEIEAALN